jgi:pimeloyl-ACP methyl ester carboxylesterase
MPWIFALHGRWSSERALDGLSALLDSLPTERTSVICHSFSGGLALGLARRHPDKVAELVFADTLGVSREWGLADEFFRHPTGLLAMATVPAAAAFGYSITRHPDQRARAAWWGFTSDRQGDAAVVHDDGLPCHVLWADRDSLLSRDDGRAFAKELGASFTLASCPGGKPADHDWVFRHPQVFVERLEGLGLSMFESGRRVGRDSAR